MNRIEAIEALGMKVGYDYEYRGKPGEDRHRVDLVDGPVERVNAALSSDDWVYISQRESPGYIGPCCGTTGAMQDIVNSVFRDSGWFDGGELLRLGRLARTHEGFETFAEMDDATFQDYVDHLVTVEKHYSEDASLRYRLNYKDIVVDPWYRIGLAYSAVVDRLEADWQDKPHERPKHHAEDDAWERGNRLFWQLEQGLREITYGDLFARSDHENSREKWANDKAFEDSKVWGAQKVGDHAASRLLKMAKLVEPMRHLQALLESGMEPFEGYALVRRDEPEKPAENGYGMLLFHAADEAQAFKDMLGREPVNKKEQHGEDEWVPRYEEPPFDIVAVKVTFEDGLTLGEKVP